MRYVVVTLVWILLCVGAWFVLSFEHAYKMRMESLGIELPPAVVWRIRVGDFLANYSWFIALFGMAVSFVILGATSENESRE